MPRIILKHDVERFGLAAGVILLVACALSDTARAVEQQKARISQAALDKQLVADFSERVADYMKLHEKLQKRGERQREREDIGENLVSQQALAMRIRFERDDARPGDIFTPSIAMALRRALDPELRGLAALGTRESIRDDAPEIFVLVVNGDYPDRASRSTMPANVLQILPPLPAGLEYRILDNHLVLIDRDADIVVDYVLDVMCKVC